MNAKEKVASRNIYSLYEEFSAEDLDKKDAIEKFQELRGNLMRTGIPTDAKITYAALLSFTIDAEQGSKVSRDIDHYRADFTTLNDQLEQSGGKLFCHINPNRNRSKGIHKGVLRDTPHLLTLGLLAPNVTLGISPHRPAVYIPLHRYRTVLAESAEPETQPFQNLNIFDPDHAVAQISDDRAEVPITEVKLFGTPQSTVIIGNNAVKTMINSQLGETTSRLGHVLKDVVHTTYK